MGHIINTALGSDQGPLLNRVSMAVYTVAVAFVALRFFTRSCIVKKLGLDDLFIAMAVTLALAQTGTILLQVKHGRARYASELHEDEFNRMLMYKWINMLIYFVANWAVKMSILALYYRLSHERQGLPWIVQGKCVLITAGVMTVFSFSVFVAQLFSCTPVARAWDVKAVPTACINSILFVQLSGAINVATDMVLLLLPLPLLRLFRFNKKQHTALAIILSIGVIPVIASTMRLGEIVMSGGVMMKGVTWQQGDSSWTWAWISVWSQIEVDVGIIAASLPCLSPLLKMVWVGFSSSGASMMNRVPDLRGYRESWGRVTLSNISLESDVEKGCVTKEEELHIRYDDNSRDYEEIGIAETADVRIVVRPGMLRIVECMKT